MNDERDLGAIASYDRRDAPDPGRLRHPEPMPYVCECGWTCNNATRAYAHAVVQRHRVTSVNGHYVWNGRTR